MTSEILESCFDTSLWLGHVSSLLVVITVPCKIDKFDAPTHFALDGGCSLPGDQQSHFAMIGRQICVLLGMFLCKSTFIGRTRLGEVARTGIAVPCSYEWCFMSFQSSHSHAQIHCRGNYVVVLTHLLTTLFLISWMQWLIISCMQYHSHFGRHFQAHPFYGLWSFIVYHHIYWLVTSHEQKPMKSS